MYMKVWLENLKWTGHFEQLEWEDNIEVDFKEIGWERVG